MNAQMDIDKLRSAERIGAVLKAKREDQGMSQRDIALALGYRNINFISMIESGRSNPPLSRLNDIARAYGMESDFVVIMLKELYSDTWGIIKELLITHKDIFAGKQPSQLDKKLDKALVNYMKHFGVS